MTVSSRRQDRWLEVSFATRASPGAVYDYLSDLRRHGEWAGTLGTVTQTTDGPIAVGTTYRTQEGMRPGGKTGDVTFAEITALEPPRRITWNARTEAAKGPMAMRSRWEFIVDSARDGSQVTQRMRFDPPSPFGRIMLAVFSPIADLMGGMGASPKMVRKNAERLQQLLDERA